MILEGFVQLRPLIVATLLTSLPAGLQAETLTRQDTARLDTVAIREAAGKVPRYRGGASVSALKGGPPLRDTPQSVSVLPATLLRDQSAQSLGEAMRYVPGVTFGQGEGHRDAPTIRGISSTADFLVDGMRDDAQYFRDVYNVERIEALSGSNALAFGRGGGGGVINRVTKQAGWASNASAVLETGSFGHFRGTVDRGGALTEGLAMRVSGLFQRSGGFRDEFWLERFGISPSAAFAHGNGTVIRVNGELFDDRRRVDRGIPSFAGRPSRVPAQRFFGHPDSSRARARVASLSASLDREISDRIRLRSVARVTSYDKFYQNVLPGAVNAQGTHVNLSAYNGGQDRLNVLSQTEASFAFRSGVLSHALVAGIELGRQATDNVRQTGYFNGSAASISVPIDAPTITSPVEFRAAASDAQNTTTARVASVFLQDQVQLARALQATAGVRLERFDLVHNDHRAPRRLSRLDVMVSPRAGLVYRPTDPLSLYLSIGVSQLPASGEQFAGLTVTTQTLEPEHFTTREAGIRWDVGPRLAATLAAYWLDRSSAAAPSARDPGVIVLTGRQENRGIEATFAGEVTRAWDVVATFTAQQARITSRTSTAPEGARVPLVPPRSMALWNRIRLARGVAAGLGVIHQARMYAAIDNTVELPGFWRHDAALYVDAPRGATLQLNVENAFDARYFATSHGNNNILPGSPRAFRLSITMPLP